MNPSSFCPNVRLRPVILAGIFASLLAVAATSCEAGAPPNDDLASAQLISTDSFMVSGTTLDATNESFEQTSNFAPTGEFYPALTVWYKWTPSVTGRVKISVANISGGTDGSAPLLFFAPNTPTRATFVGGAVQPHVNYFSADVTANQPYFIFVGNEQTFGHAFELTGVLTATSEPTPTPPPTSQPSVALVVKTPKVSRSSGSFGKVYIELSSVAATDLTVAYKAGGTAVNGTDYKMLGGSVTVPAGATKALLKIKPLAGSTDTLSLKLTVTAGDGYTVGSSAKGKVKIVD